MTVLSQTFAPVGRSIAERRGLLDLPVAEIVHPVGAPTLAEVQRKAADTVPGVIAAFGAAPHGRSQTNDDGTELVDVPAAPDEVNEFFTAAGWTDGLPALPPTPELVDRMIAACGRDPQQVVAVLPPQQGQATIRKIAANAVMAGCLPEYLPVLLAAIEAVAEQKYGLSHRQITTHAGAPLMIVNGPIVQRIGLNAGTGVFGPGWRANATIGRAMRLVLMNIGGAIPGVTDMSEHGHPGKYSYCIAEDETANPWEPLHVERGFRREQSTVTVVNAEAPHSITDNTNTKAREILTTCASTLATLGSNNVYSQGEPILALGPEHAAYIADDGWSKRDVQTFIYEKARVPWALVKGRGKSLGPNFPKWLEQPEETDMVPIVIAPEELIVIVCGGAGGKSMGIPTAGRQSMSVTREIREPEV